MRVQGSCQDCWPAFSTDFASWLTFSRKVECPGSWLSHPLPPEARATLQCFKQFWSCFEGKIKTLSWHAVQGREQGRVLSLLIASSSPLSVLPPPNAVIVLPYDVCLPCTWAVGFYCRFKTGSWRPSPASHRVNIQQQCFVAYLRRCPLFADCPSWHVCDPSRPKLSDLICRA